MNLKYEKGTKVLIELCVGTKYEGTYVSNDNNRISISHVTEYPSKVTINNVFHFYASEIAEIKVLNEIGKVKVEDKVEVIKEQPKSAKLLSYTEIIDKCVCIDYRGSMYNQAINYLKTQPILSVIGFGCFVGRHTDISIFGFGTMERILLIDIKDERIPSEIHEILENEKVKKIVYDSKSLADCLNVIFKTNLKNIFDIQVADYMLIQKETGKFPDKMHKLGECIQLYTNETHFNEKEIHGRRAWERPLLYTTRANMTLANYYLYELYYILTDKILNNVNTVTEHFANCMVDKSVGESFNYMSNDVPLELKNLKITL